jgi:hypothetical protein
MIEPFSLEMEEIPYLREIDRNFVPEHRPDTPHAMGGMPWAARVNGRTIYVESDPDRLRNLIHSKLDALDELDAIEGAGVTFARYVELMTIVKKMAERADIDVSETPGSAFVKAWIRWSDSMEAGWMIPCEESVERVISQMRIR